MINREYIEFNSIKKVTCLAVCDHCGLGKKAEWNRMYEAPRLASWKRLLKLDRWIVGKKHFCPTCRDKGFRNRD